MITMASQFADKGQVGFANLRDGFQEVGLRSDGVVTGRQRPLGRVVVRSLDQVLEGRDLHVAK